jgi:hypothetical protein
MSVTDTLATTANTLQEWSLTALKSSDEAIVEAAKTVAGALEPVSRQIAGKTPFAGRLPQPTDVVGRWFSFLENVLAEQKRFGLDLVATLPSAPASAPQPVASVKTRPAS